MTSLFSWTIEDTAYLGQRLDKVLAQLLAFEEANLAALQASGQRFSRERIQQLLREGTVWLNDKPCSKPAHKLQPGDRLTLQLPQPSTLALTPEDLAVPIVFEDEHLLVVDKPAGMLTHPSGAVQTGTLVNALLHQVKGRLSSINGVERPGIVHRLDRDTSGLLVVAKTDAAHQGLAEQIKAKTAQRSYWALLHGDLPQPKGQVEAPLARHPKHRQKQAVDPKGRWARTHWQVLERFNGKACWVRCDLETGRTHQIRVHMAHLGHPLLGDELYGNGVAQQWKFPVQGQALQAYRLQFQHPLTDEPLCFERPLAKRLEQGLTWLRQAWSQSTPEASSH